MAPGFMSTNASCHPGITPFTAKVAGAPRAYVLSNSDPSSSLPRYCTVTVSVGVTAAALWSPGKMTLYSRPEAVVVTPFSCPLWARKSLAAAWLCAIAASITERTKSCTCCRSAGLVFLPCRPSFKPRAMESTLT